MRRRILVVTGLVAQMVLATMGAVAAAATETFLDRFDAVSYSGNNGSRNWSGAWVESGESDGANKGKAKVSGGLCAAGKCGYLSAAGATTVGLRRGANLSDASAATFSYSYRRQKGASGSATVTVSVSGNGGGSWKALATYDLDANDGGHITQSFNIGAYMTSQTQIRFLLQANGAQAGSIHFDNVKITATYPTATTTTTTTPPPTPTTTTTTTPPPTPTTTTTTTPPPTPTTTLDPGATSTTLADTTAIVVGGSVPTGSSGAGGEPSSTEATPATTGDPVLAPDGKAHLVATGLTEGWAPTGGSDDVSPPSGYDSAVRGMGHAMAANFPSTVALALLTVWLYLLGSSRRDDALGGSA